MKEYAEAIKNGAVFPPIVVFAKKGSSRYIGADGEHRVEALKELGRKTVGCTVHEGGYQDALHYALTRANLDHGLRRSSADKHHAVVMALKNANYDGKSLRDFSELCNVSHELVRNVKDEQNRAQAGEVDNNNKRPRRSAPTQDEADRKELDKALKIIKGFAYDGTEGYRRQELLSEIDTLNYVIDWLTEALAEHDKEAKKSSS